MLTFYEVLELWSDLYCYVMLSNKIEKKSHIFFLLVSRHQCTVYFISFITSSQLTIYKLKYTKRTKTDHEHAHNLSQRATANTTDKNQRTEGTEGSAIKKTFDKEAFLV